MMGTFGLLLFLLPLAAPLVAPDSIHSTDNAIETRVCEYYNRTCIDNEERSCPTMERCNLLDHRDAVCFVSWSNSSEDAVVLELKGCLYHDHTCANKTECISHDSEERHRVRKRVLYCCCHGDNCNRNYSWDPKEEVTTQIPQKEIYTKKSTMSAILVTIGGLIFLIIAFPLVFYCYRKQKMGNFVELPTMESTTVHHSCPSTNVVPRPIQLLDGNCIARGRFGGVWKAQYLSSTVAVKIFPVQDHESWMVEKEIYSLPQMSNDFILQYIGAEERGEGMKLELWLITAYHEYGSLYDFLKSRMISWVELRKIGESMARGLAYLHNEKPANKMEALKPTIAHRDFKSKNVLLKSDMTACISDFGLAMTFYPGKLPGESHGQVGTRRYMAPEVLEGAIYFHRDAFLPIDMYACGLVLWELVSRCSIQDIPAERYQLPFEDVVGQHPTLEIMQQCVVTQKTRPTLKPIWSQTEGLATVVQMMQDCWDHDAEARLSASCIVERFVLLSRHSPSQMPLSNKVASM